MMPTLLLLRSQLLWQCIVYRGYDNMIIIHIKSTLLFSNCNVNNIKACSPTTRKFAKINIATFCIADEMWMIIIVTPHDALL